jgi:hypothetical protein
VSSFGEGSGSGAEAQQVLRVDGQREHAIAEGSDRRQVFLEAAVSIDQRETDDVLEVEKRATFDLAVEEMGIKLPERRAGARRFEIVVGAEQTLPTRLPLAIGDGAERVEPALW